MEKLIKVDGLDRFLLIASALIFADLPQIVLYFLAWPLGWLYGLIWSLVFGFVLHAVFDIKLLAPRMGFKALVYFLMETVPLIGAFSLLSVAMFVITFFHNTHADQQEEEGEEVV